MVKESIEQKKLFNLIFMDIQVSGHGLRRSREA